jgi:hypothetical protein
MRTVARLVVVKQVGSCRNNRNGLQTEDILFMGQAKFRKAKGEYPTYDGNNNSQVFLFTRNSGQQSRIAVWNGRKNFSHNMSPLEIDKMMDGKRIAIVQVGSPVGVNGRSSMALTKVILLEDELDIDGIIHWARDTETYQSIIDELSKSGLSMVDATSLISDMKPEVIIMMPVRDK